MTQQVSYSKFGTPTLFTTTQVIRTVDLQYNNLYVALSDLASGAANYMLPIAIVTKALTQTGINSQKDTQTDTLQGVLVSYDYYTALKGAAASVVPYIQEIQVASAELEVDDRFGYYLALTAPIQLLVENEVHTIPVGGVVTTSVPFVDATLQSSLAYVSEDGSTETITYSAGDAGDTVTLTYLSQALNPTYLIEKEETPQPASLQDFIPMAPQVLGVFMNPTLAGLLGITLPTY